MKKVLSIFLICFFCISLIGCSSSKQDSFLNVNKKVICTKTTEENGEKVEERLEASFENEHLEYFKGTTTTIYADEETAKTTYSFIDYTEEILEDAGFEVESKLNGRKIVMTYEGDMEEISKKSEFKEVDFDYSYDTNNTSFEEQMIKDGYICK